MMKKIRQETTHDSPQKNQKKSKQTLVTAALMMETIYVLYMVTDTTPAATVIKYMAVHGATFLVMTAAFRRLKHHRLPIGFPFLVIGCALVFGLTLVTAPPGMSDDVYRYVWDGKMQFFNVNPYAHAPDDPLLKPFHSPMLPGNVNFPHIKTIYPPLAQWLFRLSYGLWGEGVVGMKCLFLATAIGAMYLFYLLLRLRGGDERWLLFFAWNPLVIMETAVNGHLDMVMVFFVLWALWLAFTHRPLLAGTAMACAVLTKWVPLVMVPPLAVFFFTRHRCTGNTPGVTGAMTGIMTGMMPGIKTTALFLAPMPLVAAALFLPFGEPARNMFNTALNYAGHWYFNNPLFHGFLAGTGDNTLAHALSFGIFVVLYPLILLRRDWGVDKKLFFTVLAFLLLNPCIHPWYLIWLTGLLCLVHSPAAAAWSGLVVCAYGVVFRWKSGGPWRDSWPLMIAEYLPMVMLLLGELKGKRGGCSEGGDEEKRQGQAAGILNTFHGGLFSFFSIKYRTKSKIRK